VLKEVPHIFYLATSNANMLANHSSGCYHWSLTADTPLKTEPNQWTRKMPFISKLWSL